MTSSAAPSTATKRALLIGIDAYVHPYELDGAVNDARAMGEVLRHKFAFDEENIALVTDAAATKDGILDAFDDLIDATQAGDVVVFYYAGHGTRLDVVEKATKASGSPTALCPVDESGEGPVYRYILDDEIHERLLELTDRTPYVTVIVDACHSGTVTRDAFGDRIRNMTAGKPGSGIEIYKKPRRRPKRPIVAAEAGPSGWLSLSDKYVLIAGCRDEEVSNEYSPPGSDAKHGVLTYFLTQELGSADSGTTYRDIFERTSANVSARKPNQHPQIEGSIDRAVFGVSDLLPMSFARVVSRTGDRVTLHRGAAHGMTVASVYDVYPQGTKRIPSGAPPLGTLEIVSVGAVQSVATVTSETAPDAIAPDTRAFEISHAQGTLSMAVAIVAAGANTDANIAAMRTALAGSPILDVVSADRPATPFARVYLVPPRASASPADPAPELGAVSVPTWAVVGTTGRLLFPPKRVGEEVLVRENLEKVVKYTQALELGNPNPRSALRGKFTLELMRRDSNGEWCVAKPAAAGGLPVFEDREAFAFRITSTHDEATYISLLDFQPNFGLDPFFPPQGAMEKIAAKGTFEQGTVEPGHADEWVINADFAEGETEQHETIKLFVTSTPADFSLLKQAVTRGDLAPRAAERSPITALFRAAVGTAQADQPATRAIAKARLLEKDPDDWTTATASFIVRRTTPAIALGASPQRLAADGTSLRATGITGEAVVHAAGSGRVPSSPTLDALSAALAETGGQIARTIEIGNAKVAEGTRDLGAPAIELEVPATEGAAQMLVRTDADGTVTFHFPQATDGVRDIGAGGTLKFSIPIETERSTDGARNAFSALTAFASSSIGSQVLTLVVYPAVGGLLGVVGEDLAQRWESSARPYRARRFSPDDYASDTAPAIDADGWKKLATGRSLLLLHDAFDRTHGGFGAMPKAFVAELDKRYEGRVFAFDHFTLSHDPRRNARMLIDAIGLPADVSLDVDILAHGRGGLVARALVEGGSGALEGAARLRVHDVILAGTPNAGTPFADVENIEKTLNRYTTLAGMTLTAVGGQIAGGVFAAAKSAAFKMAAQLKGLSAMKPASPFLDSLKGADIVARPDHTPRYFAIASDFEPQEPGLVRRLRNVVADKTIGSANDLIVSTKSVLDVPAKFAVAGSLVLNQSDGVAHSSYFANTAVHARILEWLAAPRT